MTCIVGYIDRKNKKAYIGGDSDGSNHSNIGHRKDKKVFEKSGMLFGYTTSYRMGQLLKEVLVIPDIEKDEDEFTYMVTKFIPELIKIYDESKYLQKDKDGQAQGGFFITILNDRLFVVESDFQVHEPDYDYTSVGSGMYYALGSLYTSSSYDVDIKAKLTTAINAAIEFNPFVRGRIDIVSKDLS